MSNTYRKEILQAANKFTSGRTEPYTMRTICRAVFCVRQHQVVSDSVLAGAGFRAHDARPGQTPSRYRYTRPTTWPRPRKKGRTR